MIVMHRGLLLVLGLLVVAAAVAASAQEKDLKVEPIRGPSASTGSATRTATSSAPAARDGDGNDVPAVTEAAPIASDDAIDDAIGAANIFGDDEQVAPRDRRAFSRYDALLTGLTVFALAVFVGFEVISKVPTTLHTPLMSGSNAISGITVVGAIIIAGHSLVDFSSFLGFLAISLAMINVVGGFLVTHRMLSMFKRK